MLQNDIRNKTVEKFKNIWGVGPAFAVRLFMLGLRSIEELRNSEYKAMLNRNQKVGLKYYEDLIVKIPRDEVKKVVDEV